MSNLLGSIQILVKTDAQLMALGSPWIPKYGQQFVIKDMGIPGIGLCGIGDGVTAYVLLPKANPALFSRAGIQSLPLIDNNNLSGLLDYAPYRTSTGQVLYKNPAIFSSNIWNDALTWNDTLTWND